MKYGNQYYQRFFQNKMKVCLYNSFGNIENEYFDKTIWCPLSKDIVHIVQYFRKSGGGTINFSIESVFRQFMINETGEDVSFFKTDKIVTVHKNRLVAFYSQSDTLAHNTLCIISGSPDYRFINYIPTHNAENSDIFFTKENIPFVQYSFRHLKNVKPDILVMYNDWTKAAIRIISHCHLLSIPVVCIQESIIDFGDSFKKMQHADNVMIQGPKSATELPRKHFYLTGNPRYFHSRHKKKSREYVLINCNFTYNIYEEIRTKWLDDITSALDELGINYLISQHPRDNGDLSKYKNQIKSSSSTLKQQLEKAGLVITRFSSIIHESLIDGIPVIYYNPHNEQMQYDFDFNSEFLLLVRDRIKLKESLCGLYKKDISGENLKLYLNTHCLPVETESVANINYLLTGNTFDTTNFSFSDIVHLVLFQPVFVSSFQWLKHFLSRSSESKD